MQIPFKKILLSALIACFSGATAQASPAPDNASLSPLLTAGIFRIESERSYKLSLQMSLGVLNAQAAKERERSLAEIESMRKALAKSTAKGAKTAREFKRVNSALNDQLKSLTKVNASNASATYDVNEDLLNKMNFLSFALEAESEDAPSRISGLALRQASLAQRMAKIMLLRSVDKSQANKQGLLVDLEQSKIEFMNGLSMLEEETADGSRMLRDSVALAKQQWLFYDASLKQGFGAEADIRNISTTSDRIAEMMINIVRLGSAADVKPPALAHQ
jgi:hypothetical protein